MNRIEALSGESSLNGDPAGDFAVSSAGRAVCDSPTSPASPQRARVRGIRPAMILLTAFGIAGSGSTAASDGVLEINQTCAVQTGCFAGDTAGLPVEISTSGSYRLTSNLEVPNQGTNGIAVGADNVSIDLGGFEIQGPVVCSGTPIVCAPSSGVGSGVYGVNSAISGTSVRNGSIRGMGNFGVNLGVQAEVNNLRVRSNRTNGINGINAGFGSTVSGNTAYANVGDGIQTSLGSTVWGNTVGSNLGYGLNLGALSGYRENVISINTQGTVTGGFNLGDNLCDGVPCPDSPVP